MPRQTRIPLRMEPIPRAMPLPDKKIIESCEVALCKMLEGTGISVDCGYVDEIAVIPPDPCPVWYVWKPLLCMAEVFIVARNGSDRELIGTHPVGSCKEMIELIRRTH